MTVTLIVNGIRGAGCGKTACPAVYPSQHCDGDLRRGMFGDGHPYSPNWVNGGIATTWEQPT